jgi:hypothetical protein
LFVQVYRWFPSILQVLTIIRPETLVRWHWAGFRLDNKNIAKNEAYTLRDPETRKTYAATYAKTSTLYYGSGPTFDQILERIGEWIDRL